MSTGNRLLNRVLSAALGFGLLVAALLGLAEIVAGLFGSTHLLVPREAWLAGLRATPWSAGSVRVVGTTLLVAGVLLLIAALTARSRILRLRSPKDTIQVTASARSLAQILRREAEAVPGVAEASAEVTARSARVTAGVPLADPVRVERELAAVLGAVVTRIGWEHPPSLSVEVSSPRTPAASPSPVAPSESERVR